ncbi:MAG: hypothetical protein R3B95_10045 [Nitrospirales bacterium]|nr:hypothetical protein [Nitrospirales bacterium]
MHLGIRRYGCQHRSPNIIEGNVVWNCGQGIVAIADAIVHNNIVIGTPWKPRATNKFGDEKRDHRKQYCDRKYRSAGLGGGNLSTSLSLANNVLYGGSITNPPSAASFSSNLQYNFGGEQYIRGPRQLGLLASAWFAIDWGR